MMKTKLKIEGVIPAMITPLCEDQSVNPKALCMLVDHFLSAGVHGLFVLGNQGEFWAFTRAEKEKIIEITIEQVDGRVPVYVGVGAIASAECIDLGGLAAKLGANALCIITPYLLKPSQAELFDHYKAIASETNLPIILYNNPARTGVNLHTKTVVDLAMLENIVGIKDSSGSLTQTMDYILECPPEFAVLAGNDALICAALIMGGVGAISASANVVPRLLVDIYDAVRDGDFQRAIKLQYKLIPLRRLFALGTFPIMIKEALNLAGLEGGPARSPVKSLSQEDLKELRGVLRQILKSKEVKPK